jgi:hypothetical protein
MNFEMTIEERDEMYEIAKPVPVMKIGNYWSGMDTQERANDFWKRLGSKYGFVWDTVKPSGSDHRKFTAEPTPPKDEIK